MKAQFPNLELLEYMVLAKISNNKDAMEEIKEAQNGSTRIELDCQMFRQLWGSTATAFNGFGGDAMTYAYTVVFYEVITNTFYVFVDNKPAYIVSEPTELFYDDLKNHCLRAQNEAWNLY